MNAHWVLIIVILVQHVLIFQEVLIVHVKSDTQEMELFVKVCLLLLFPFCN